MSNNTTPKEIDSFTRALWWIAGATPEILEKYPSEYAKFSAIGMTIAMTCIVAFVSGMAAAWYFSSNIVATISFGLFWALLIFCIDRALVVTMKKSTQPMSWSKRLMEAMKIIIPRAILAVLVALLMSIPLELIVFEDIIDAELPNYESKKLEDASRIGYDAVRKKEAVENVGELNKEKEYSNRNLTKAEKEKNAAEKTVKEISFQVNTLRNQRNTPNTPRYRAAVAEVNKANSALRITDLNDQQRASMQTKKATNSAIMKEETRKWAADIDVKIRDAEQKLEAAQKEKIKKTKAYEDAEQKDRDLSDLLTSARKRQAEAENNIDDKVTQLDFIQKKTNKFILHYSVLEYAVYDKIIERIPVPKLKPVEVGIPSQGADDSIVVEQTNPTPSSKAEEYEYREEWHYRNGDALTMLWLIRILFFIFEMMPTVVKAVSKPGPYERECEAQDEQMARFFTSTAYRDNMQTMLNDKLQHERKLAEDRRNAEKALHDHLLAEIQTAQKDVAVQAINKWRSDHMNTTTKVDFGTTQHQATSHMRSNIMTESLQEHTNSNSLQEEKQSNPETPKTYTDEFD